MNENRKGIPVPVARRRSGAGQLLQILRDGRARTRSELALETGAARSTVASRLDALLSAGFVRPAGEIGSSGGRPPSTFTFNPSGRVVLAVHVKRTQITLALTELAGKVQAQQQVEQLVSDGPETVLDIVIAHGLELLQAAGRHQDDLAGIGLGFPGSVDHETGRPAKPQDLPGWDGFDVVSYLQRSFPVPLVVDNEVNMMAVGERARNWPEHDDILFIHVDRGVNAAIFSGGRLQHGAGGIAGALGSVRVPRSNEEPCSSMRRAGRDLGEIVAVAVNLLNPSVIVVGGSMAKEGEYLVAGIREVVFHRSPPSATARLSISMSICGDQAAVLGASHLVAEHVLKPKAVEAALDEIDRRNLPPEVFIDTETCVTLLERTCRHGDINATIRAGIQSAGRFTTPCV